MAISSCPDDCCSLLLSLSDSCVVHRFNSDSDPDPSLPCSDSVSMIAFRLGRLYLGRCRFLRRFGRESLIPNSDRRLRASLSRSIYNDRKGNNSTNVTQILFRQPYSHHMVIVTWSIIDYGCLVCLLAQAKYNPLPHKVQHVPARLLPPG